MKVIRKTNQQLVVADSSIWVSVLLLCFDAFVVYRGYVTGTGQALVLAGILTLFAFLFWRKEVVVFDRGRQEAEWKRIRAYKLDDGIVPFSEITGIGMDSSWARNNAAVYRLKILTAGDSVPLSDVFRGDKNGCDQVRAQILEFLNLAAGEAVPSARNINDNTIQALLRQDRKADAVELVRASEKVGLSEAQEIVNEIEDKMKAAQ